MNKLYIPFLFATLILQACGGSGGNTKNPSQSSSSTVILSSSSKSSALSSSSSSLSSSSSSTNVSSSASSQASSIAFTLMSNSFVADANIPIKYSCYSTQVSPHLKWDITSDAVKSFVLIMEDIDAIPIVGKPYVHWDVYNIPGSVREIAEGATLRAMPMGSIEGANDDKVPQYSGPCPPTGTGTHHYYFALYAINTETLTINAGRAMQRDEFEKLYASYIIAKTEIVGLYRP